MEEIELNGNNNQKKEKNKRIGEIDE